MAADRGTYSLSPEGSLVDRATDEILCIDQRATGAAYVYFHRQDEIDSEGLHELSVCNRQYDGGHTRLQLRWCDHTTF